MRAREAQTLGQWWQDEIPCRHLRAAQLRMAIRTQVRDGLPRQPEHPAKTKTPGDGNPPGDGLSSPCTQITGRSSSSTGERREAAASLTTHRDQPGGDHRNLSGGSSKHLSDRRGGRLRNGMTMLGSRAAGVSRPRIEEAILAGDPIGVGMMEPTASRSSVRRRTTRRTWIRLSGMGRVYFFSPTCVIFRSGRQRRRCLQKSEA